MTEAKVGLAPVSEQKNDGFNTIANEAYGWYNNPLSLGGTRPRGLIPLAIAYHLAQAIGRPLTQADLELLIQKDGEPTVCAGCGQTFQPVRWATVNESLIAAIRSGVEICKLNGEVRWAGSRIVKVNDKGVLSILSLCGSFFFYDPKRRDAKNGAEFFCINRQTCLGQAYHHDKNRDDKGKPRPVRSLGSAEELIRVMDARYQARLDEVRHRRQDQAQEKILQTFRGVSNAFDRVEGIDKSHGTRGGPQARRGSNRHL